MNEEKLRRIYLEYLDLRDQYLSSRWHKIRSFALRIAGRPREFARLLGYEEAFRREAMAWLDQYIRNENFSVEHIEHALLTFELYKGELSGRSSFLVVISIILAANIAFFNQISELIGEKADFWMILFGFVTVLLIVLERSSVARHTHASEQLIALVKNWISTNKD